MARRIEYKGRTAVITGASSGIGMVFAEALARRGANVVLVARSKDKLSSGAEVLAKKYAIDARLVAFDLSTEKGPDAAFEAIGRLGASIDILVNNAGFGSYGRYENLSADRDHAEIMLNVVAVERLTHLAVSGMLARRFGVIMNVASTSAFQPLPYMAVYAATKAFVLSFSEALWAQYRERGIHVLAVCPGATETNFFNVVGSEQAAGNKKRSPEGVVEGAFRALERGRSYFIDGALNYFQAQVVRLAPRGVVARGAEQVMRPK